MSDASGMYASPTGARPQNGGAGQGQGNNEGFNNESFQLDDGDQHLESAGGRRTSIGTMATLAGGAGTPSPAQQEPQAQPMDPLVQSLMSGVRLSNKKISDILDKQSELEASLEANIQDDDGWKALEQLQEQLSRAIRKKEEFEAKLEVQQQQVLKVQQEQARHPSSFTHHVAHHQHPPRGSSVTSNGAFVPGAGLSAGSGSGAGPPAGLPQWGLAAGTGTGFAALTGHADALGGGRGAAATATSYTAAPGYEQPGSAQPPGAMPQQPQGPPWQNPDQAGGQEPPAPGTGTGGMGAGASTSPPPLSRARAMSEPAPFGSPSFATGGRRYR